MERYRQQDAGSKRTGAVIGIPALTTHQVPALLKLNLHEVDKDRGMHDNE